MFVSILFESIVISNIRQNENPYMSMILKEAVTVIFFEFF